MRPATVPVKYGLYVAAMLILLQVTATDKSTKTINAWPKQETLSSKLYNQELWMNLLVCGLSLAENTSILRWASHYTFYQSP